MDTTSKKESSTEATVIFGTMRKECKISLLALIKCEDIFGSGSKNDISIWQIRKIISKLLCLVALHLYIVHSTFFFLPKEF